MGLDLIYNMYSYLIIQTLDVSVLVPILFAGAVNLHPVAIIAAVQRYLGFWGLFCHTFGYIRAISACIHYKINSKLSYLVSQI